MSTPIPIPSLIANRYRVIREIGRGGMGSVYLVKHLNTGDYMALKLLHASVLGHSDSVERFKREMRLPAKIRSAQVVKITDADTAPELDGAPFLVMELLNGCDLGRILSHYGTRSREEVLWVLGQITRTLDKAHALGIIHRDLKPENLFVHRQEEDPATVKILDFGIAKLTEDIRRTTMREAGELKQTASVGTPMYMSPEQAQGQAPGAPPITAGADIWAIGMMVFEFLTNETYWRANNAMELMGQLFFAQLKRPSLRVKSLPAAFDDWFLKSCDRDPAQRFHSTSEQLQSLVAALGAAVIPGEAPKSLVDAVIALSPAGRIEADQDFSAVAAGASIGQADGQAASALGARAAPPGAELILEDPTQFQHRDQLATVPSVENLKPAGLSLQHRLRRWVRAIAGRR